MCNPMPSWFKLKNTEKVGFEPTVPFSITGFQDQLLKPLGHLSICFHFVSLSQATHLYYHFYLHMSTTFFNFFYFRKCQVFLQHFFKKIFNIVYLLFIIYNDIIRLQLQLFLSSFLKKCIEKRLSSGSHFLYAPLSFILLIFPFH